MQSMRNCHQIHSQVPTLYFPTQEVMEKPNQTKPNKKNKQTNKQKRASRAQSRFNKNVTRADEPASIFNQ
jgi:hypothetical protein